MAATVALLLALGIWFAPLTRGNDPNAVASWVAADGRVWAIAATDRTWQHLPGIADATVTEIFRGRVVAVRRTGGVSVWAAPGERWQDVPGAVDIRDLSCGPIRCVARLADGRLVAWDESFEPARVAWEGEAIAISVAGDRTLVATEAGAVLEWTGALEGEPRRVGVGDASLVAATSAGGYALSRSGQVLAWTGAGEPSKVEGVEARRIARAPGGALAITLDGGLLQLGRAAVAVPGSADCLWLWPSGDVALALDDRGDLTLRSANESTRYPGATFHVAQPEPAWESPPPVGSSLRASLMVGPAASDLDVLVARRLEEAGFETRIVRQDQAQGEADLLVVSSSVVASRLPPSTAEAPVPMLVLDAAVLGRLGLVVPGPHGYGLSPGLAAVGVRPLHALGARRSGRILVAGRASWLPHVQPSGGVITTVSEAGLGLVFGWETPRRRAALLLGPSHLTAAAWQLFDEAVRWAVDKPVGPVRDRVETERLTGGSRLAAAEGLTGGTGTILLVVGSLTLSTYDASLKSMIEAMGFTVETKVASAAGASDATGKVLVFVSASSPNGDILTKFLNVTVPVLIQAPGIVDDMLMTSAADRGSDAAASQVAIVDPEHAIAHPLTGSVTVSGSAVQNWGVGSASSQSVAATNASSGHHALFVYPSGASMVGMTAPARRAFYGLVSPAAETLTASGVDLFERMIFWATGTNRSPEVDAGPDRTAYYQSAITLEGSVFDDGLPGSGLTASWSQVSGPATATFGTPASLTTTATFPITGLYVLRLTVSDGPLSGHDDVEVQVYTPETNVPPVVQAGSDALALTGQPITLAGTAVDDALPPASTLHYAWSKTSGPGTITFGAPASASTTATFSAAGSYVVRLTVTEKVGATAYLSSFDELVVSTSSPVLLVVGSTTLTAGETALKARFEALGYPVVVQLASATASNDANDKAFVWISSTSPNEDLLDGSGNAKFLLKGVPIALQSAGTVDDMGMTGTTSGDRGTASAQTQVAITAATHGLSAGLTGTLTTSSSVDYDWGVPAAAAAKVASRVSSGTQSVFFAYEEGQLLANGNAAAGRRLFFGLGAPALATLTASGQRLVDAAIWWLAGANARPWADAGSDQTIAIGSTSLAGRVVDDGRPVSPGVVTASWEQRSGPTAATIASPSSATTSATFAEAGVYVLALTAADSALTHTDLVTVRVVDTSTNAPPSIALGPDRRVEFPASLALAASVFDDGRPLSPGTVSVSWSKVAGPGTVTFTPAAGANTTVTFSAPGSYRLRAMASDGAASSADEITVVVEGASGSVLFVVGGIPLSGGDTIVKNRLEGLGFTVTATTSASASAADGKALVAVSGSVDAGAVAGSFAGVAVPVITWEPDIYVAMGLAATAGSSAGTDVTMTGLTHPLSASLTGTQTVHAGSGDRAWGAPGAGAVTAATIPGQPGQAAIFGYETGETMASGTAPARRVGFFWHPGYVNATSGALFDAAVLWATRAHVPALLVVGSTSLSAADAALKARLVAHGLVVSAVSAADVTPAHAAGKAVVFVSPTADPLVLGARLRDVTTPVILANRKAYESNALTGPAAGDVVHAVSGLPTDGRQLYVRLSSYDGSSWPYRDYTLQAAWSGAAPALLTTPAPGATLAGSTASFTWSPGVAIDSYRLSVGNTRGGTDVYDATLGGAQTTNVTGLPTDGRTLYVRLWSRTGGAQWLFEDYEIRAYATVKAAMTSPVPGLTLGGTSQVFTWDAGIGVTQYWLYVGTSLGGHEIYTADLGTSLTTTVSSLPSNGSQLYVRLYSRIGGAWTYVDYKYQAKTSGAVPAVMLSPSPGSALGGAAVSFEWDAGSSISEYWLHVGSSPGGTDLHNQSTGSATSTTVSGLPTNGSDVYVRLWSRYGASTWLFNDFVYRAHTTPVAAVLQAPAPGRTLPGAATSFSWSTGTGITSYRLAIGSSVGGTDLHDQVVSGGPTTSDSVVMTGVSHPLAAGLAGTRVLFSASASLPWGVPSAAAISIAQLNPAVPEEGRTIFAYEVGAAMVGVAAPDRRIAFPLASTSASGLTDEGARLLDAAIAWALASDRDGDGLGVFDEILHGTDPGNPDSNGDGVLDGTAVATGRTATATDADGDGITNAVEFTKGTDPFDWDTDGDGSSDAECFPLDAARTGACAGSVPGDTTPPTITLTKPAATLVSSVP